MDECLAGLLYELSRQYDDVWETEEELEVINEHIIRSFIFINWLLRIESLRVSKIANARERHEAENDLKGKRALVTSTQQWMRITDNQINTLEESLRTLNSAAHQPQSPPSVDTQSQLDFNLYMDLGDGIQNKILGFLACPYDKLSVAQAMPSEALRMGWNETDLHIEIGFANQLKMGTVRWSNYRIMQALMKVSPEWNRCVLKNLDHYLSRGSIKWRRHGHEHLDLLNIFPEQLGNPVEPFTLRTMVRLLDDHTEWPLTMAKLDEKGFRIWDLVLKQAHWTMTPLQLTQHIGMVLWRTPNVRRVELQYLGIGLGGLRMLRGMIRNLQGVHVVRVAAEENGGEGGLLFAEQIGGNDNNGLGAEHARENDGADGGNVVADNGARREIMEVELPKLEHLKTLIIRLIPFSGEEMPLLEVVKQKLRQVCGGEQPRVFELLRVNTGYEPEEGIGYQACECGRHTHYFLDRDSMQYSMNSDGTVMATTTVGDQTL